MPKKPVPVYQIITSGDSVSFSVQETISEQRRLLKIVRQNLSESIAGLVVGCVRKKNELILLTESQALASRLRFHSPAIRDALTSDSPLAIESVKIRVVQAIKSEVLRATNRKLPSLESIGTLRECSHLHAGSQLQTALKRLADTLEKQQAGNRIDRERNTWRRS